MQELELLNHTWGQMAELENEEREADPKLLESFYLDGFIDARKFGTLVDRTRKEFSDNDIAKIAGTYHAWREGEKYEDVPGFCKAEKSEEIGEHNHILTPGRYVGAADAEDDDEPFPRRFGQLETKLEDLFAESGKLTAVVRQKLARVRIDE